MSQDGMAAKKSGVHLVTCSQLCVPPVSVSSQGELQAIPTSSPCCSGRLPRAADTGY